MQYYDVIIKILKIIKKFCPWFHHNVHSFNTLMKHVCAEIETRFIGGPLGLLLDLLFYTVITSLSLFTYILSLSLSFSFSLPLVPSIIKSGPWKLRSADGRSRKKNHANYRYVNVSETLGLVVAAATTTQQLQPAIATQTGTCETANSNSYVSMRLDRVCSFSRESSAFSSPAPSGRLARLRDANYGVVPGVVHFPAGRPANRLINPSHRR